MHLVSKTYVKTEKAPFYVVATAMNRLGLNVSFFLHPESNFGYFDCVIFLFDQLCT